MNSRRVRSENQGSFSGIRVESAIIDIGSNTVRLVLYGGAARAPVILFNEKVVARLARDMESTGLLADAAMDIALRGLNRFALLLEELGVKRVSVVATAAVRDAQNGQEFLQHVAALGFDPRLISGVEEARLSAQGVCGAFTDAHGLVADLGGGSVEIVPVAAGEPSAGISLPLGTLRLESMDKQARRASLKNLPDTFRQGQIPTCAGGTLYLVGGTFRAMAVAEIDREGSPLTDPHGFTLPVKAARALAQRIETGKPADLAKIPRIRSGRAVHMPTAAALFSALLECARPDQVTFSSWGLREGALYDSLPARVQNQDALLAGVTQFAALRGCPPLFATRVAAWTVAASGSAQTGSERLRLAATMLALAAMQIEPNLRIDLAIEWALNKRWIGISAPERAMLAAAVSANGNRCSIPARLAGLASKEEIDTAIGWGLATRLCRRLGGRSTGLFNISSLKIEGGALVLSIAQSHAALFGSANESDLDLLAGQLDLTPYCRFIPETAS